MGHQLSEEDHEHLDLEFRLADRDGNGIIDWWEFLNYQAKVKLAMRDQVGRNTEYLPTIHLLANRHQNGITHIHVSSLLLCIHCSLSMWFSTQATPTTLEYGSVIKTLRERAQCKELHDIAKMLRYFTDYRCSCR